jgi:hypothetical protein
MAAGKSRHQNRHYKTLIALVVSMTGSTFFLLWVGRLSPVTPLRGQVLTTPRWSEIAVRTETDRNPRGFFHLRIDSAGQLYQSSAWKIGQPDPDRPQTIHVLLTSANGDGVTAAQKQTLAQTLADLRLQHGIPASGIAVINVINRESRTQMAGADLAIRF